MSKAKGISQEQHAKYKAANSQRWSDAAALANDLGSLPEPADAGQRAACGESFQLWCETYRPEAFFMGWSDDHLKILKQVELTVRDGGLFALAMPRGCGKTTIVVSAAIWALLYGYARWVCLIGATGPRAQKLLSSIKTELRFNAALAADFPEVCGPIIKLEGKAIRANSQTHGGVPTNIIWHKDELGLPFIEGSQSSAGIVTVAGITGDIRGQQKTTQDGKVIRPDYVILDDPQTRESAKSGTQTDDRISTLMGDILGLSGPGVKISGVMPCTVISRGDMADQILDRDQCPEWHGERTQLLYGWPVKMDLWGKYQEMREEEFRNSTDEAGSLAYYMNNQDDMDLGCKAAWDERHTDDEASGIQHAMNLFYRDEAAFWAEFQNQPLETSQDDTISEDELLQRTHPVAKGSFPTGGELITAFVDVQKDLLYYCVIAWRPDFTGWIVDYGAWPDQKTTNFRLSQAKKTIGKQWPGQSLEVVLTKALNALIDDLCSKSWQREDGAELSVSRLLIDANWGLSRNIVYEFSRNTPHRAVVMPSHGKYVGASNEPLNATIAKRSGKRIGEHWRIQKAKDNPAQYVLYDANHWKSFLFSRFATEPGTAGALTLFQASPRIHKTFVRHLKAEYPVRTSGRGREVDEWKLRPDRPDNHWLDCAVGCCVAASIQSCDTSAKKPKTPKKKKTKGVSYL